MTKNRLITDLFVRTKKRAIKHNFKFNITKEYLHKLYDNQQGKCALTNIEFCTIKVNKGDRQPYLPSLDRIDSHKGYVIRNVRFVCFAVNMALFTWGESVFDEISIGRYSTIKHRTNIFEDNFDQEDPDLATRWEAQKYFNLCSSWFNAREKAGLEVPEPIFKKMNKKGCVILYKYSLKILNIWFLDHKKELKWKPSMLNDKVSNIYYQ